MEVFKKCTQFSIYLLWNIPTGLQLLNAQFKQLHKSCCEISSFVAGILPGSSQAGQRWPPCNLHLWAIGNPLVLCWDEGTESQELFAPEEIILAVKNK